MQKIYSKTEAIQKLKQITQADKKVMQKYYQSGEDTTDVFQTITNDKKALKKLKNSIYVLFSYIQTNGYYHFVHD